MDVLHSEHITVIKILRIRKNKNLRGVLHAKIISWYMEHKTYGNILIIGIIGLMLYNIGYGVGTAIYRIFG